MVPGPPPLGSWGASRELPGGGSRPKVQGSEPAGPLLESHQNLCRFRYRFLIFLGSILDASWGSCWAILAPWSAQVGPGTVFEPSYLRKSDFSKKRAPLQPQHENEVQDGPRWHPKRPKIAPRQVQDRLGSIFFPLDFSLRFWIAFGSALVSFWVPKWSPRDYTKLGLGPLGPIQDGLRIVLVRSFLLSCRLGSLFWPSWPPLGVVLGNSWNRFGPLGVIFEPLGACLRVSEVVFGASLISTESSLLPLFPTFL